MESKRPDPTPELTTVGLLPVQFFVSRVIPMPPGTPAKPQANRPPLQKPDEPSTELSENGEKGSYST